MAVGRTVDAGGLNVKLADAAVAQRDAAQMAVVLWNYVASLGADEAAQVAALQGLGFSAGDAQAFWTRANNLFAVSQVYHGNITQPSTFNYDSALAQVRGLD